MSRAFLDTNIFLRHILNDDSVLSARARDIIVAVEQGALTAWTSDLVVAELVFVLSGKQTYNQSPEQIATLLVPIIQLPHLKVDHKRVHLRAFDLFSSRRIDYIDAYNAALMEQHREVRIFSFDRDFDRVPGIARYEEL